MSVRRPATARLAPALLAVAGLVLTALLAGLTSPVAAGAAPSASEPKPTYGAWSSYFFDVRVRVATPTKKQRRAYVQVNRNNNDSGDRQFRFTWQPKGDKTVHSSRAQLVKPGGTITFYSQWLPCGTTRLTLIGRQRPEGGTYSEPMSFSADVSRSC